MKLKRLLLVIVTVVFALLAILLGGHLDWFKPVPVGNEQEFTFRACFEDAGTFLDIHPKDFAAWHGRQWMQGETKKEPTSAVSPLVRPG